MPMINNKKLFLSYILKIIINILLINSIYCKKGKKRNEVKKYTINLCNENLSHTIKSEQECLSETALTNFFMKGYLNNISINENYYSYSKHLKQCIEDTSLLPFDFNKKVFSYWIENEGFNNGLFYITNCLKCLRSNENLVEQCKKCPALKTINKLKALNMDQTLDEIIYKNKSIARYGDGEFKIMFGRNMRGYQKSNKSIELRLKEVFDSNDENLIIGNVNAMAKNYRKKWYRDGAKATRYWRNFAYSYKYNLINILDINKTYGCADISRFYNNYKDRSHLKEYIDKLKLIWENRDVVLIEGDKTRFGVGNDLLDNVRSIQRIICPSTNAYDVYDDIYNEALKIEKNKLLLIALGPTATILAYDLHKAGYQAIDIGHADIEYEWFIRKAESKIRIENKFVNEARGGKVNIADIDKNDIYYQQIISTIAK